MSRNKKIFLGILTFSPIIGMIFYFICFIGMFSTIGGIATGGMEAEPELQPEDMTAFMGLMGTAMIILFSTILVTIGMTIYYVIHVVNNKRLDKEKNEQVIWILLVLIAGYIGQCVYWYMKIWKENPEDFTRDSTTNTTID